MRRSPRSQLPPSVDDMLQLGVHVGGRRVNLLTGLTTGVSATRPGTSSPRCPEWPRFVNLVAQSLQTAESRAAVLCYDEVRSGRQR